MSKLKIEKKNVRNMLSKALSIPPVHPHVHLRTREEQIGYDASIQRQQHFVLRGVARVHKKKLATVFAVFFDSMFSPQKYALIGQFHVRNAIILSFAVLRIPRTSVGRTEYSAGFGLQRIKKLKE